MVAPDNGATQPGSPQGPDPADIKPQPNAPGDVPSGAAPQGDHTAAPAAQERIGELEVQLAERTEDLQRLHAEYVNYKRRVDRDRDLARASGIESVINDMLPIFDDLRAARQHEEQLTGGFKLMAEELDKLAAKHGLEGYGEKNDPFDPHLHDALMQANQPGVQVPTCIEILQPGYKLKDRILRPARVAVAIPTEETSAPPAAQQSEPEPPQGAGSAESDPAN